VFDGFLMKFFSGLRMILELKEWFSSGRLDGFWHRLLTAAMYGITVRLIG